MRTVQPTSLTTEELLKHADMMLLRGALPMEWQREILRRFERMLDTDGNTTASDPRQLNLF